MLNNRIAFTAALLSGVCVAPLTVASAQEATAASQAEDVVVVRYQYVPDDKRATSEVASFLSADDFVLTGDSSVADALGRVSGITISDGRFPVVRGLNERYSNTLLNGSPLASPEPLLRAAPLDLFPTSVVSNVLVQKTFSPQFPGEFGGGLVAIETSALPAEGFFEVGLSAAADTETSLNTGLLHDGGSNDRWGFGDNTRQVDDAFKTIFETTRVGADNTVWTDETLGAFGRSLENSKLWVVQEGDIEPDWGVEVAGGQRFEFDNFSLGLLASVGFDNEWQTKDGARGDITASSSVSSGETVTQNTEYDFMETTNNIALNGLVGLGVEFGDHEIQLLSLVLRSTDKETRTEFGNLLPSEDEDFRDDQTAFFERQVYTYQLSGDHMFEDLGGLEATWRAAFSDASRNAPNQRRARYEFSNVNGTDRLVLRPDTRGNNISFSRVDEEVTDYGIDFTLPVDALGLSWEWKAGYASNTRDRSAFSRDMAFSGSSSDEFRSSRVDYIFADPNIGVPSEGGTWQIRERGASGAADAYDGELDVEGAYIATDVEITPFLRAALGARWENGELSTRTFNLDNRGQFTEVTTEEDYILPAATLTWTFADNLQARFGYSETITRPQFRELGFALFTDTELDQRFVGNPYLVDTEITNYDARLEWYFGRNQFVTAGVFYKELENPIVEYLFNAAEEPVNSYLNAPEADIWGFEIEFEKTFDMADTFGDDGFWSDAEVFVNTNYTYSQSEISVDQTDTVIAAGVPAGGSTDVVVPNEVAAFSRIVDGQRLNGQSDHIVNLQLGWEAKSTGTRTALLLNWNSDRVRTIQFNVSVDNPNTPNVESSSYFPEVIEEPPLTLDLVHNRTIDVPRAGELDLRFAIRNILGEEYHSYQEAYGEERIYESYDLGTTFSISLKKSF
ncbi:TonB-dependent receptor domain-containing protein [Oceanicaulis sp. MMSF_3324]|uniref:TonB-dependent receptor domain-containing protein n=1 Tax=Oceanicaulis sp. MMSF_3324 TaxID=3046702 RepID=UPI00273D9B16|nr:TonB-dependent receptor [Oceanicaulis sp. MMSF_3324]